jgi:hypothetical protein
LNRGKVLIHETKETKKTPISHMYCIFAC